jgi:hypothetical protein
MKNQVIRERILAGNTAAAQQMEHIRRHPHMDFSAFYICIRSFLLSKFLLDGASAAGIDSIGELSALSIQQALQISGGDLASADISLNCSSTSSVVTKKVLLLMAIQRELGIRFDPAETAEIETVTQLAETAYHLYKQ